MLWLLDAPVYVFRAWFSLPDTLTSPAGQPANAFRGYAAFLTALLEEEAPEYLVAAFDESLTSSFRNEIYPEYKSNRELPPVELERQFRWCQTFTEALGVPEVCCQRNAAYYVTAPGAALAHAQRMPVTVLSRDKDLGQLLRPGDRFWPRGHGKALDYEAFGEKFGLPPERMADYLALVGDPVDAIPGVPGIGARSAALLLNHFENIEALYAGIERIPELPLRAATRVRDALAAGRDQAFLSRRLARLAVDAPLPWRRLPRRGKVDHKGLAALDHEAGLGRGLRQRLGLPAQGAA
jgi:DNA polymerase I